ncbi:2-methylcitrate dehydratase PrpD [Spinactinospora alkalitolerans]|uniref:2-methylcitrate dehydratase PrpD n=1 Tax=Spinactinospora alkalitolerans TaxID=687207 RepID=A0A852TT16_9ACTN|nr:MmgE/PrpD family protein [Spinactinospora alkalitolerans]NYE47159.1 2-methylcitrate dehydratase PrpD [Spinactinospora alkalitolerans]
MAAVLSDVAERAISRGREADSDVRELVGLHVLDVLGAIASGARHPLADRWLPLCRQATNGGTALGATGRWPQDTAIEIESTLAHLDEFDPVHSAAGMVPGSVVIPAALAVGASIGATGRAVADAIIAGYEAAIESALRFGGSALYQVGWWPSALFGALGSAAATASLLNLDVPTTTTALGLAVAPFGGLLTADEFGAGHYLLCGTVAARGAWAARAAEAGLTASHTLLNGPATAALGRQATPPSSEGPPHIKDVSIKAWPCARPLHSALTALDELAAAGLDLGTVDAIDVFLPRSATRFVTNTRTPVGPAEAAASATVALAGACVRRAADPGWYREIAADPGGLPDVSVHLTPNPALDAEFPHQWPAEIVVGHAGGTVHRRVHSALGDPDRRLPPEQILAKARKLLGIQGEHSSISRILDIDNQPDVARLRADAARLTTSESTVP